MSRTKSRQAEAYRRRAEEVRTTAQNMRDPDCRQVMRRLAAGYDRLADTLDRVTERPQTHRRPDGIEVGPHDTGVCEHAPDKPAARAAG